MQHLAASAPVAAGPARVNRVRSRAGASIRCAATAVDAKVGTYTVKGTVRKQNEDRFDAKTLSGGPPQPAAFYAVYDGHGGFAVAEWLSKNLPDYLVKEWKAASPATGVTNAFKIADEFILEPQGFLGMGSRGLGGPQCGSTAVIAIVYTENGKKMLLTANVGDARAIVVRGGKSVMISEDHVPDNENERRRIESKNPNPKKPLVRFVGSTWRVGGLLALSRAFGDAYLKPTGDFEGFGSLNADYSSGFGVEAAPFVTVEEIGADDQYIVLSSDGLYANEERGGGGGLQLDDVATMVLGTTVDANATAKMLADEAVRRGSTDDVTVMVIPL